MKKLIFHNEEINFSNILSFLDEFKFKILRLGFVFALLFLFGFFFGSHKYEASVSFYSNYSEKVNSSFFSLSDLARGNELRFNVEDFLDSNNFKDQIINKEYLIDGQKTLLTDYWSTDLNKFTLNPYTFLINLNIKSRFHKDSSENDMKIFMAKRKLARSLSFSEDRLSKLSTVSVEVKNDPYFAEQLISEVYNAIVKYSNDITNIKAREKRIFVSGRLQEINSKLKNSEDSLVEFISNNKNLDSPNLRIQRERLEREVLLYNQLYISLSDQLELAKIDEKDNTSSIYMLEMPSAPTVISGYSLLKGGVYSLITGLFLGTFFFLFSARKKYLF
mgnify:CR=1 FL=1